MRNRAIVVQIPAVATRHFSSPLAIQTGFEAPPPPPRPTEWVGGWFPRRQRGWGVGLFPFFHELPGLRMSGAIPHLPHILSRRSEGKMYHYFSYPVSEYLWNNRSQILVTGSNCICSLPALISLIMSPGFK